MGLTQVNTSSHMGQSYYVGRNKMIEKTDLKPKMLILEGLEKLINHK